LDKDNKYTLMQRRMYASGTSNHEIHNENDDYWEILLKDIKSNNSWKNKKALDFACGKGRNVSNLLTINKWKRVDGVDISTGNIKYCKDNYKGQNSEWYVNNGIGLEDLSTNEYHFVLSTIALQHIPVYEIRTNLLKEILRVMAPGGIFSFQMGYGPAPKKGSNPAHYYDNAYDAPKTNSEWDVRIDNEQTVIKDLKEIGFINVTTQIRDSYSDDQHPQWIYIRCEKGLK